MKVLNSFVFVLASIFAFVIINASPSSVLADDAENVIAAIKADKQLTEFASLLDLTDVSRILELHGPFTVFAPTNDAIFKDLSRTEYRELKDPKNKRQLIRFLGNHIAPGESTVENFEKAKSFHTWTGQVFVHPGKGLSTDAKTIAPYVAKDKTARNGILQVIGGILRPKVIETEPRNRAS